MHKKSMLQNSVVRFEAHAVHLQRISRGTIKTPKSERRLCFIVSNKMLNESLTDLQMWIVCHHISARIAC